MCGAKDWNTLHWTDRNMRKDVTHSLPKKEKSQLSTLCFERKGKEEILPNCHKTQIRPSSCEIHDCITALHIKKRYLHHFWFLYIFWQYIVAESWEWRTCLVILRVRPPLSLLLAAIGRHIYKRTCRRPFSLLTMLQIFSDGPSFSPMYFIIISEVKSNRALPSISCDKDIQLRFNDKNTTELNELTCFWNSCAWMLRPESTDDK